MEQPTDRAEKRGCVYRFTSTCSGYRTSAFGRDSTCPINAFHVQVTLARCRPKFPEPRLDSFRIGDYPGVVQILRKRRGRPNASQIAPGDAVQGPGLTDSFIKRR